MARSETGNDVGKDGRSELRSCSFRSDDGASPPCDLLWFVSSLLDPE